MKRFHHKSFSLKLGQKFLIVFVLVVIGIFALIFSNISQAAVAKLINYQAKVIDSSDNAVTDGNYDTEFRICAAADCSGGSDPLWTEDWDSDAGNSEVTVTDGLFTVQLGTYTALDLDFNDSAYYLGVNFNNDGWMTPQKTITGTPYSLNTNLYRGQDLAALTENFSIKGDDTAARTITLGQTGNFDDLLVVDTGNFLLNVSGDGVFYGDLVVGGTTSTPETLSNAGFELNGDDLFVAGTMGVESDIYSDGNIYLSNLTSGSVLFAAASGKLAQDNTNFFWDDSNNRLGIGTNSPATALQIGSTSGDIRMGDDFDIINRHSLNVQIMDVQAQGGQSIAFRVLPGSSPGYSIFGETVASFFEFHKNSAGSDRLFLIAPTNTSSGYNYVSYASSPGPITFGFATNTLAQTKTFYLLSDGTVGVGASTPGAKLEVEIDDNDNVAGLLIDMDDVTNNPYALVITNAGTGYSIHVDQGDVLFDENLVVGGSTSAVETLSNAGFVLNGDDLFVAGLLGVEGDIYTDGNLSLAAGQYINWGATLGTNGYGFRDNSGTMEYKNSAGSWLAFDNITGLWEDGVHGVFEDDEAVIVGADAAFTYVDGGVGDLRVADDLEVIGDFYTSKNFLVGADTFAQETIYDSGFSLNGDDMYVAGNVGVEGDFYTDGNLRIKTNVHTNDHSVSIALYFGHTDAGAESLIWDGNNKRFKFSKSIHTEHKVVVGNTLEIEDGAITQSSSGTGDLTISTSGGSSGILTFSSNEALRLKSDSYTDDYLYIKTTGDGGQFYFQDSYLAFSNPSGFRLNKTTGEMEYRDEDEESWTAFDSLSSGGGLWTNGTYGYYSNTESIIVGPDTTFYYVDSPGAGDLKVSDDFEVLDDAYIGNDFYVGAETSATETIENTSFTMNGNDMFLAGMLGVESDIYTDGNMYFDDNGIIYNSYGTGELLIATSSSAGSYPYLALWSAEDLFLGADDEPDDYITISVGNETGGSQVVPAFYFNGIGSYTNAPGFSVNDSGEIVYRDEDSATWTSLDSLSSGGGLWSLGTYATYRDDDVVVGGDINETLSNTGFSLNGSELFVSGMLGVESDIYTDGTVRVDLNSSTNSDSGIYINVISGGLPGGLPMVGSRTVLQPNSSDSAALVGYQVEVPAGYSDFSSMEVIGYFMLATDDFGLNKSISGAAGGIGLYSWLDHTGSGAIKGAWANLKHSGSGNIYGEDINIDTETGFSGNSYGINMLLNNTSSSQTSAYGINIDYDDTGVVDNLYGIYMDLDASGVASEAYGVRINVSDNDELNSYIKLTTTGSGGADFSLDMYGSGSDIDLRFNLGSVIGEPGSGMLAFFPGTDTNDYVYLNEGASEADEFLWYVDGYAYDAPGIRFNISNSEMEYRDENDGWVSFDSLAGGSSLWTLGTFAAYRNDDIIVGADTSDTTPLTNTNFIMDGNDLYVQGMLGVNSDVYTNGSFIAGSTLILNDGFIRDSGDLNLQADADVDDYIYLSTGNNVGAQVVPAMYFAGIGSYTNAPGISIDDSGQLVYRDQDSASWVAFDSLSGAGGSGAWTDAGGYIYPTTGEFLGNNASAGANKIAGLYLGDSSNLGFGTDNDVLYSFSDSTLGVTFANNADLNFDSNTFFIDSSEDGIGIGTNSLAANDKLKILLGATEKVYIDAYTTEHTGTDGVIDIDYLSKTSMAAAIDINAVSPGIAGNDYPLGINVSTRLNSTDANGAGVFAYSASLDSASSFGSNTNSYGGYLFLAHSDFGNGFQGSTNGTVIQAYADHSGAGGLSASSISLQHSGSGSLAGNNISLSSSGSGQVQGEMIEVSSSSSFSNKLEGSYIRVNNQSTSTTNVYGMDIQLEDNGSISNNLYGIYLTIDPSGNAGGDAYGIQVKAKDSGTLDSLLGLYTENTAGATYGIDMNGASLSYDIQLKDSSIINGDDGIRLFANADTDDYIHFKSETNFGAEQTPVMYFAGIGTYSPAFSVDDSGQINYRDGDDGVWNTLDSLSSVTYWSRTGTDLSPVNAGDDILLNAGEALTISDMTSGSVLFAGTGGLLSQDNSNLYYDSSNHKLGLGTNNLGNAVMEIETHDNTGLAALLLDNNDLSGNPNVLVINNVGSGYSILVDEGDVVFDEDLIVGGSTSRTETLENINFSLSGDDLFVAGDLGVESGIYTDGSLVVGTTTTISDGSITQSTTGDGSLVIQTTGGGNPFLALLGSSQVWIGDNSNDYIKIDSRTDTQVVPTVLFAGVNSYTDSQSPGLSVDNDGQMVYKNALGSWTTFDSLGSFVELWTEGTYATYRDDDVVIGGDIDETIANGFVLTGNELYVGGDLGVEGNMFTDGDLYLQTDVTTAGTDIIINFGYLAGAEKLKWDGTNSYFSVTDDFAADSFITSDLTIDNGSITQLTGSPLAVVLGGAASDDFTVDSTTLVVESDADQVGIGVADPAAKLNISSAASVYSRGDGLAITHTGGGDPIIAFQPQAGFTKFSMGVDNDDDDKFKIGTNSIDNNTILTIHDGLYNRIGINTTTPSTSFHVQAATGNHNMGDGIIIENNSELDYDPFLAFSLSGSDKFTLGVDDSDSDKFKIGTSSLTTNTRLTIDSSGNIGIGDTSPDALFDLDFSSSSTSGSDDYISRVTILDNGSLASGTDRLYGYHVDLDRTNYSNGDVEVYGYYADVYTQSGGSTATTNAYGMYSTVNTSGSSTRTPYGGYFSAQGGYQDTYGLKVVVPSSYDGWGIYVDVTGSHSATGILVDAGDVIFDEDLIVGGSTSRTETLSNTNFSLSGDDMFVAGMLGAEAGIYTDNGISLAASNYINWGATLGSSGYGIRDNSGTLQYKDSSGDWADFFNSSDLLWDLGNFATYRNDDVIVGADTSDTTPLTNTNFIMDGDDLFVTGMLGVKSDVYTNGSFIAGSSLILNDDGITDSNGDMNFTSTNDGFNFYLGGGAGDDFTIDNNLFIVRSQYDRVGIGTANPSARLDIDYDNGYELGLQNVTGIDVNVQHDYPSTSPSTIFGIQATVDRTAVVSGDNNTYGLSIDASSDGSGTATVYGGYFRATGGDINYGILVNDGDSIFDDNVVVGGDTSRTETIDYSGFSLGGDDLFVAGSAGVEGDVYVDGTVYVEDVQSTGSLTIRPSGDTDDYFSLSSSAVYGTIETIGETGLYLKSSGDRMFFQNGIDSALTGFQFLDANGGHPIMYINTQDEKVAIGKDSTSHTLDVDGNIGLDDTYNMAYINWGTTDGESGIGFRNNWGTLEYKHSGGTWGMLGLWQAGTHGTYEDDDDVIVGENTSDSTPLTGNNNFQLNNQHNLYVEGMLGVSSDLYTIGSFVSGLTVSSLMLNNDFIRDTGDLVFQADNDTDDYLTISSDSTDLILATVGDSDLTINASSGELIFQNTVDATTGLQVLDADGGTPVLNVDTTNERVGIGDASPSAKLDIDLTGDLAPGTTYRNFLSESTLSGGLSSGSAVLYGLDVSTYMPGGSVGGTVVNYAGHFEATGGNTGDVDSSGYGLRSIATDSDDNYGLYASASGSGDSNYGIYSAATDSGAVATNYGIYALVNGGATNYAGIFMGGNVGIGTNTPSATLDVDGSAIFNDSGANKDFRIEGDTEQNLFFVDASADGIGIGTNTPSATLSVDGSAIFNESGANVDFRVESTDNANMFFVDANRLDSYGGGVGIGTNEPVADLEIENSSAYGTTLYLTQLSTYDPFIAFNIGDVSSPLNNPDWKVGVDNSDNENFEITTGISTFESSYFIIEYNDGDVMIPERLMVGSQSAPDALLEVNNLGENKSFYSNSNGYHIEIDEDGKVSLGNPTAGNVRMYIEENTGAWDDPVGLKIYSRKSTVTETGTDGVYGIYSEATDVGGSTGGTVNYYGGYFKVAGSTAATSNAYGIYSDVSGADSNYAGIFMGGAVGIGTNTPDATLEVDGSLDVEGSAVFNDLGAAVDFRVETDTEEYAFFASSTLNMIGINESLPESRLHITNTSNSVNSFQVDDQASDTTPFVISENGKVGIGIATPDYDLEIETSGGAIAALTNPGGTIIDSVDLGTVNFAGVHGTGTYAKKIGAYILAEAAGGWDDSVEFDGPTELQFRTQSDGSGNGLSYPRMTIESDGTITICEGSCAAPDHAGAAGDLYVESDFEVDNEVYFLGVYSDTVTSNVRSLYIDDSGQIGGISSSKRYKENIYPIAASDFEKVLQLEPVEFDYISDGFHSIGFIAEEADSLGLNQLVYYDKNGVIEGFAYEKLQIYLLGIVRTQQKQIDALVAQLNTADPAAPENPNIEGTNWKIDENGVFVSNVEVVSTGETKEMYAMSSTAVEFTISGSSKLENGEKQIYYEDYDLDFNKIVSGEMTLKIIVTPTSECQGIFVAQKETADTIDGPRHVSFTAKELNNGSSDATFDWIVIGRRAGYENEDTGAPEDPAPEDPAPEDPAPEDPAPEDPAPEDPAPEDPAPEDPAPEDPAPEDPAPEDPAPEDPAPEDPAPEDPAPEDPAPEDPAPEDPAPEDPAPEDPAPEDPVIP